MTGGGWWWRSWRLGRGWGWGLGLRRGGLGGVGETIVVVGVDGLDDGVAPIFFAAGGGEFMLGEMEGLEHGLGEVGEGACGARLQVAASDRDEDTAEGGVEVVGGEIVAGEEVREIFGEVFVGAELSFFFGVVETEVGTGGDAGSAAAAAVIESETA